jgi:hypothetical protein
MYTQPDHWVEEGTHIQIKFRLKIKLSNKDNVLNSTTVSS